MNRYMTIIAINKSSSSELVFATKQKILRKSAASWKLSHCIR